jgi:hypothetical protein
MQFPEILETAQLSYAQLSFPQEACGIPNASIYSKLIRSINFSASEIHPRLTSHRSRLPTRYSKIEHLYYNINRNQPAAVITDTNG